MMQKFEVTAQGEGRMDIVSRISMLYLQRHIEVESLSFSPIEGKQSCYKVLAVADEITIKRLMGQLSHIEGLDKIECKLL